MEGPISNVEPTVLVVEPSGSARDLLASVLRQWGFHVVVAGDAQAAVAYLDALPRPSLLIIGQRSSDRDAEELIARVCERKDAAALERVLWAATDAVPSPAPASVRAVLPRPFELSELEAIVTAWRDQVAQGGGAAGR